MFNQEREVLKQFSHKKAILVGRGEGSVGPWMAGYTNPIA